MAVYYTEENTKHMTLEDLENIHRMACESINSGPDLSEEQLSQMMANIWALNNLIEKRLAEKND